MQERRKQWIENLKTIDFNKMVFLDESSVNLAYTRLYGRAVKNKRIRQGVKDCRFQRQSILSTVSLSGKQNPIMFKGTLNKELFIQYLKTQLKNNISADEILVMDNSSVHTAKAVINTLDELNIKYLFLPPYSPDFNPIELLWSKLKSILRKLKARTNDKLESSIKFALNAISLNDILNWFKHCGYAINKS